MNKGETISIKVTGNVIGEIDHRLFGQFLEKASFGEPGPENALDSTKRRLRPEVEEIIREMKIPVIRFPGGTDIDYSDWRDMIDHVPAREVVRPEISETKRGQITNHYGYDEFLRFAEELGTEDILVLNFRAALSKAQPLREAALLAAGLVAYCNSPVGSILPEGMPDWPSVRAKNGHPEPYGVHYFQIGNEIWGFLKEALQEAGFTGIEEQAEWFLQCLNTYIDTIREVDPSVEIITDGELYELSDRVLLDSSLKGRIQYVNYHSYSPWEISGILKNGEEHPFDKLTREEEWYAWVTLPFINEDGRAAFSKDFLQQIERRIKHGQGWNVSMTEWNWNGWYTGREFKAWQDNNLAKGLGASVYLHALMREGSTFKIAAQSNLIGWNWGIGAVRVDPDGKIPPYCLPTGQVTEFYSKHHGSKLMEIREGNIPYYSQPLQMGKVDDAIIHAIRPVDKVAMVDALVTKGEEALYLHAVNRNYSEPYILTLDISGLEFEGERAIHHLLEGKMDSQPVEDGTFRTAWFTCEECSKPEKGILTVTLPERSISIVEIRKI